MVEIWVARVYVSNVTRVQGAPRAAVGTEVGDSLLQVVLIYPAL